MTSDNSAAYSRHPVLSNTDEIALQNKHFILVSKSLSMTGRWDDSLIGIMPEHFDPRSEHIIGWQKFILCWLKRRIASVCKESSTDSQFPCDFILLKNFKLAEMTSTWFKNRHKLQFPSSKYRTDTNISEVLLCIETKLLSHYAVSADELFV